MYFSGPPRRHRARFVVLRQGMRKIRAFKCMRIEEEEEEEVYAPAEVILASADIRLQF
jgi:hypothetical protein